MSRIRIGLAQVNVTVGDIDGNATLIAERLAEARERGVDIVAFPELAVCGYPPEDLLLKPAFVEANRRAIEQLLPHTADIAAVVGFAERHLDLHNSAALLHDGEWVATYRKQRLPNYGVFDELRYFKAGRGETLLRIAGARVGVSICEDIWLPGGPVARLARAGADVILNINASPYHRSRWRERHRMLATRASDQGVVIGYVNLVGGQDELVFDGNSVVFGAAGELLAEAPPFEDHLLVCDVELEQVFRARLHDPRRRHALLPLPDSVRTIDLSTEPRRHAVPVQPARRGRDSAPGRRRPEAARPEPQAPATTVVHDDLAEVYGALVLGTRDYMRKNGFENVVLGLSGGIDSSVVAAVAVDALGADAVTGVTLPSRYTSDGSASDAAALADLLGIRLLNIAIEDTYAAMLDTLAPVFAGCPPDVTEENLQARIRGNLLMALSNKFGWLLLTTGNKSEMATGYATLYGDMAGGFAVLKDVPKTLVYELARWRNTRAGGPVIPEGAITKPPSAELRPDQRDEDSLPPYAILDPILERYVEDDWSLPELVAAGFDEERVRQVIALVDRSEYKRRQSAPGVKITPRAFGKDRRLPITSGYRES